MRLKIVHQLSLLLLAAVVLAMVGVGGVVAWNLRSGFAEYRLARDDVQLDRFVQLLELRSAPDPSMQWLRGSREAMELLVDEFASVEGLARPVPRGSSRGGRNDAIQPDEGRPPRPFSRPLPQQPPPPPHRPPPPGSIAGRIQILDAQGQWLAGREQPRGAPVVSRLVFVRGQQVASVILTQEHELQGVDTRFLQRQYGVLGWTMVGTLLLSLLLAWWVARRWSRPLRDLQQATQRMARGELGFQIPASLAGQGSQEIAGLVDDVNHMSQALATLESARRVWIAQLSHELRTPLAVLQGEIESIEDGARQPTPAVMASLRDEVLQLVRLVNDLHTLSMADLGQLPCEFVEGDAQALLRRVAQRFEPRAVQRGLVLEFDGVPETQTMPPSMACWDFGRIEQLLTNLLENSLRYTTPPGRVVLRWQTVLADPLALGPCLLLTLEDTAPSVAPQQLQHLFEPLFRADVARGRGQGGSGLGLSIAQAIVKAHQGRISASVSALGGLRIQVYLPLQPL
jgi:two-component system sensor histidine kinase BaeS